MTLEEVSTYLKNEDHFILTAHESPDGDAIGAVITLYYALKQLGKDVQAFTSDPVSEAYQFIDPEFLISVLSTEDQLPANSSEYTLIVLDTNPENVGRASGIFLSTFTRILIIDHHNLAPQEEYLSYLLPEASSTCEMLYDVISSMGCSINSIMAQALFSGIVYDTGSFIYPKTSEKTFSIAEKLVSQGVSPTNIYASLFENKSVKSLRLQSKVLNELELFNDNSTAVLELRKKDLQEADISIEETHEYINIPLQCKDVRISIFLKENINNQKRCSLRSKGELDCALIARDFGGGGHKTAAGFKFDETFQNMKKILLDKIST